MVLKDTKRLWKQFQLTAVISSAHYMGADVLQGAKTSKTRAHHAH